MSGGPCECGHLPTFLVTLEGEPARLRALLPRALGQRGESSARVLEELMVWESGVSLQRSGPGVDRLLRVIGAHELRAVVRPVDAEGVALGVARAAGERLKARAAGVALGVAALALVAALVSLPRGEVDQVARDAGPAEGPDAGPPLAALEPPRSSTPGNAAGLLTEDRVISAARGLVEVELPGGGFAGGVMASLEGHALVWAPALRLRQRLRLRGLGTVLRGEVVAVDGAGHRLIKVEGAAARGLSPARFAEATGLVVGAPVFTLGFRANGRDVKVALGAVDEALVWRGGAPAFASTALRGSVAGAPVFDALGRVVGLSTGGAEPVARYAELAWKGGALAEVWGPTPVGAALGAVLARRVAPEERARPEAVGPSAEAGVLVPVFLHKQFGRNTASRRCPRRAAFAYLCPEDLVVTLLWARAGGGRRAPPRSVGLRFVRRAGGVEGPVHVRGVLGRWQRDASFGWQFQQQTGHALAGRARLMAAQARFRGDDLFRFLNAHQTLSGRFVIRVGGLSTAIQELPD